MKTYYYSVLTLEELADIPKDERIKYLGVVVEGKILQPAKCYECEAEIVLLDEDGTKTQCTCCGILNDVYFYDSWSPKLAHVMNAGFVGTNFYLYD